MILPPKRQILLENKKALKLDLQAINRLEAFGDIYQFGSFFNKKLKNCETRRFQKYDCK